MCVSRSQNPFKDNIAWRVYVQFDLFQGLFLFFIELSSLYLKFMQVIPSPFDHSHVVTSTTHKTLRAVRYCFRWWFSFSNSHFLLVSVGRNLHSIFSLKKIKIKNSLDEPFEPFNISLKYFFGLHLQSWFNLLPCWCQRKKQENWKRYPL